MGSFGFPICEEIASRMMSCVFTESAAGLVPADWGVRKLGELASLTTGPFGTALHKSDYIDGGVPLVNPMHILDGQIIPDSKTSVSEDAARRLTGYRMKPGDIVIARRGQMGRCAVVQESQSGWLCGTGCLIIRCSDCADAVFVQRVLTTDRAVEAIEEGSVGSTMTNLNHGTLSRLPIQFPPRSERRAIASALSDADALIESLDRLIDKKRAIKQAAMEQLLTGETRLREFEGEWKRTRLGELGRWRGGATPSMAIPEYWENGRTPWVSSSDIRQGRIASVSGRITDRAIRETSVTVVPANSVLVVVRSGILRRYLPVVRSDNFVAINQDLMALEPSPHHDSRFLMQALLAFDERIRLDCVKSGTTVESVDATWFRGFEIDLPGLGEQRAIADALEDMDSEIEALERRRDKARRIKQGMMQELLRGRTRLVGPNREAAEESPA